MSESLDDARQAVSTALDQMAEAVEQYGADMSSWHEHLGDLERAGEGLYEAMAAIDPDQRRCDISGLAR